MHTPAAASARLAKCYACRPTQFYRPLGLLVLGLPNSFLHLLGCLKFGFYFTTPFLSIPSVTRLLLLHSFFFPGLRNSSCKPNTNLQWKRFTSGFLCTGKYSRKPFSGEKNHRASKHALRPCLDVVGLTQSVNPHVLGQIRVKFSLNSTAIHPNTCGFMRI